ncbi:MAG: DNA (cytosine-5-)-methyltransferase [Parcubacteria group bacterium Gr01-1014_17]|nr:MAG: DNA (cytosine-5-)-methyltransferase [Parcubacteria group bacterium Gr01-1014_17]
MKKKNIKYKLAELFSGPGGLALGAIRSFTENEDTVYGIEPVWANDCDADTCKTYARNIHRGSEKNVVCAPIQEIDFKRVPRFDALAFGFPCNDFSVVGEQKGFDGKFGPLYSYGVKAINTHNPKWFIAENVSGLQSANGGSAFKQILKDLGSAGRGYVLTPHLYKFEDYGVPQQRHRIVIVGIRKDLNLRFRVPTPTTKYNHMSAREAIENPQIPKGAQNHELTKQSAGVIERLKHIPAGENAWYEGIPIHLRLNVVGARMSQIYKRLDPQKPSYTITGSGGGGTHVYHWSEHRALTNRERARLQSFPDSFVFEGSKESARKQIGMAVPPVGAQIIISAVLKTFAKIPYESVESKLTNGEYRALEISSLFDTVRVGVKVVL